MIVWGVIAIAPGDRGRGMGIAGNGRYFNIYPYSQIFLKIILLRFDKRDCFSDKGAEPVIDRNLYLHKFWFFVSVMIRLYLTRRRHA